MRARGAPDLPAGGGGGSARRRRQSVTAPTWSQRIVVVVRWRRGHAATGKCWERLDEGLVLRSNNLLTRHSIGTPSWTIIPSIADDDCLGIFCQKAIKSGKIYVILHMFRKVTAKECNRLYVKCLITRLNQKICTVTHIPPSCS
jgi:hypothetical protein